MRRLAYRSLSEVLPLVQGPYRGACVVKRQLHPCVHAVARRASRWMA